MGLQLTPLRVTKVGSFPEKAGAYFYCWDNLSFCGVVSTASLRFNWIDYFDKKENKKNKFCLPHIFHQKSQKVTSEL